VRGSERGLGGQRSDEKCEEQREWGRVHAHG
jgi:hypothetical protein